MKLNTILVALIILMLGGFGYYLFSQKKQTIKTPGPFPTSAPTQPVEATAFPTSIPSPSPSLSPSPYPDTKSAIAAFLANKYKKPISEVNVTVSKEVPGFAAGSVSFGQGGPGESGAWLGVLGNGWEVVWDGNGSVDCNKMRQQYGFPDSILKPGFCN